MEFNKKIKQILYNGYPINGSNFNSGTDSISLSAFRKIKISVKKYIKKVFLM